MANVLYEKFKENLLKGLIDLSTASVKCVLVDSTQYTRAATHATLADIPAGSRENTSAALTGLSVTDGQFASTGSSSFASSSGNGVLVLYVDSGTESTSYLICYDDSGTGLPVPVNAGEVDVTWPSPIFSL